MALEVVRDESVGDAMAKHVLAAGASLCSVAMNLGAVAALRPEPFGVPKKSPRERAPSGALVNLAP